MNTFYWIWFQQLFGFGTARSHVMLEEYPHPEELYQRLVQGELAPSFLHPREREDWQKCAEKAKRIQETTRRKGCHTVTPEHPEYPPLLHEIYAKPTALYVKGSLESLGHQLSIAMVGARKHTEYGVETSEYLAEGLAQAETTVVSGLALGIDSICLESALRSGGKVVGILACGLDIDYPKGSSQLKRQVCENGAVLSEYPMGTRPYPFRFPPRNRLLSGMSRGTVVIEAGDRSGALITARHTLEQGRDLFVVPGSIFSGTFAGSHRLIQQGAAKLICSVKDILSEYHHLEDETQLTLSEDLPTEKPPKRKALPEGLEPYIVMVYDRMSEQRQTPDDFVYATDLAVGQVLAALTTLEILGLAESHPGGTFTLP